MSVDKRDSALSEVIGMILIIAILVAAMSVYVTYMVPEKGKAAEIRHMNDVRGSFLELSYLIHSLWVNGQTGVPVAIPIRLHSVSEPSALPLFAPISSQGVLSITNTFDPMVMDTFTITLRGFSEERVSAFPPTVLSMGLNETMSLRSAPYKIIVDFIPSFTPDKPISGLPTLAKLRGGTRGSTFSLDLMVRSSVAETTLDWNPVTIEDYNVTADLTKVTKYKHSLIAVENSRSNLEYVVIDEITGPTSVDIKPVIDLFPGARLVKNSSLEFDMTGVSEDLTQRGVNVTVSYGAPGVSLGEVSATSSLSDLTFTAGNYYWVDQVFRYQKGAVFLLQDYLDSGLNTTPLSDAPIRVMEVDGSLVVAVADINVFSGPTSRLSSSGGSAQVISEISQIVHHLCTEPDGSGICYDASDGTASVVEFKVISHDNDENTLRRWSNMFSRVCTMVDTCWVASCLAPDCDPGQTTLIVEYDLDADQDRLSVQYTKVDVNMEIRP